MSAGRLVRITTGAGLLAATCASAALAQGTAASHTCLQGFLWRGATAADRVCVTPASREQARQDNAAAASRLRGDGTDACRDGFVWREAVAGDRVCVTPQTHRQVMEDNRAAPLRRNSLLMVVRTVATSEPDQCSDGTCTRVDDGSATYHVTVHRINTGRARLFLRRSNGRLVRTWSVAVPAHPRGLPGGLLNFDTGSPACKGAANAYFQVQDPVSRRLSNRRPVRVGCGRL